MEQEKVLHMALLAGIPVVEYHNETGVPLQTLRRFAELIATAERADCEELARAIAEGMRSNFDRAGAYGAFVCADAIRMRGE